MAIPPQTAAGQRHHGEQLRRFASLGCALSGLFLALSSATVSAAEAHAAMMVSTHVMPMARMQIAPGVPQLRISAADVASGYVDAPRPIVVRIDSNSRAGFAVDVSSLSPWCVAIALQGFDSAVMLDGTEGTVVQRWRGSTSRVLTLRARFRLAASVQPGIYAWPLRLSARPL